MSFSAVWLQKQKLSLHNQKLRSMLGLSRCTKLRVLDLSFNSISSIEGLEALGDLRGEARERRG